MPDDGVAAAVRVINRTGRLAAEGDPVR